jgi:hypothetical protein
MDLEGMESGFVAGAIAVALLGAILTVVTSGAEAFTKLALVVYDMGVAGLSWGLLNEAFDDSNSETLRAAMALAGGLVLVLGLRFL